MQLFMRNIWLSMTCHRTSVWMIDCVDALWIKFEWLMLRLVPNELVESRSTPAICEVILACDSTRRSEEFLSGHYSCLTNENSVSTPFTTSCLCRIYGVPVKQVKHWAGLPVTVQMRVILMIGHVEGRNLHIPLLGCIAFLTNARPWVIILQSRISRSLSSSSCITNLTNLIF